MANNTILLKDHEDPGAIFRNCEKLRQRVYEEALEFDAYYQADEILSYFRHATGDTLKDYEIGACCRNYVKAGNDWAAFLADCMNVQKILAPFDPKTAEDITRAYKKIDFYEDAACGYEDISDEKFNNLENWIRNIITEACEQIATYAAESYEQFEDEGLLEDYFVTCWLENNDTLEVDEAGRVFETVTTTTFYN